MESLEADVGSVGKAVEQAACQLPEYKQVVYPDSAAARSAVLDKIACGAIVGVGDSEICGGVLEIDAVLYLAAGAPRTVVGSRFYRRFIEGVVVVPEKISVVIGSESICFNRMVLLYIMPQIKVGGGRLNICGTVCRGCEVLSDGACCLADIRDVVQVLTVKRACHVYGEQCLARGHECVVERQIIGGVCEFTGLSCSRSAHNFRTAEEFLMETYPAVVVGPMVDIVV